MKILLTNNTLHFRAGSELYLRDVATALKRRGHEPVAFSTVLGSVADDIRAHGIPVVDTLEDIAEPPEIIHGQHHLETMTALLHFPGVPAVYFCHGSQPWVETPPRFPRIPLRPRFPRCRDCRPRRLRRPFPPSSRARSAAA